MSVLSGGYLYTDNIIPQYVYTFIVDNSISCLGWNSNSFQPKNEMELELIPAQTGNGIEINSSPYRKWNYDNVHKS